MVGRLFSNQQSSHPFPTHTSLRANPKPLLGRALLEIKLAFTHSHVILKAHSAGHGFATFTRPISMGVVGYRDHQVILSWPLSPSAQLGLPLPRLGPRIVHVSTCTTNVFGYNDSITIDRTAHAEARDRNLKIWNRDRGCSIRRTPASTARCAVHTLATCGRRGLRPSTGGTT
jgi:hypothetical protein